jgi:signal peptidase I
MSWKDRKLLKRAGELVKGSRKLVRMHRDILAPQLVEDITHAVDQLAEAVAGKDAGAANSLSDHLEVQLERAFPRQRHAGLRENVEVLLVATIVAMAVRTFFIQPFKIPTGSMQPSLYGIYPPEAMPATPYDIGRPSALDMIVGTALQGKIYEPSGYRQRGDHIFVDKISYHFRQPRRGEVIVFDTSDITMIPESSRGRFYIKRLIGLSGDEIQIQPPYVKVNGEILDERRAFHRIYSMADGYNGYVLPTAGGYPGPAPVISTANNSYTVPAKHLFVLGDNSRSSLDGRFWGSLPQRALVGRAVVVYWPFTGRTGLID